MFANDDISVFQVADPIHVGTRRRMLWAALAAAVALAAAGASAHAATPQTGRAELARKGDGFLARRNASKGQENVGVIARLAGGCTPANLSRLTGVGATVTARIGAINSVALRLPAKSLPRLAALSFVRHLSYDGPMRKSDEFTTEGSRSAAAAQQYGVTGRGVTVAVVDSGIHAVTDLSVATSLVQLKTNSASRILAQINFVPDDKGKVNANSYDDKCGHGTHVAGIVGGNGLSSSDPTCFRNFTGVAPQTSLINVRVLDANGQGTVSTVLNGLQWILNNRTKYGGIRVVNLSVGHPVGESYTTDPLCQMVEKLWKSGVVVVCAAGNSGRATDALDPSLDNEGYGTAYGSIQSPGNDPYVITVGAMKATDMAFNADGTWTHNRANDRIATYSSRGPSRLDFVVKPDIVAPGNKIISTVADGSTLDNTAGNTNDIRVNEYRNLDKNDWSKLYYRLSGTSMAAPVVAGAAALLLQKDATLTPDTVKARLMLTADKWTQPDGTADPCTFGAGYLNIPAALATKAAVPVSLSALSPLLYLDSAGNVCVNMDRVLWGTDTVNGSRVLWGVNGAYSFNVVWGDRVLWGTSTNVLDASRVLWGSSVWGDRVLWGTNSSAVDLTSTAINGE